MKQSKAKPVDVADAVQLCVSYVGLETDGKTLLTHTRARTHKEDKSSNQRPTFGVPFDTTSDLVDNAARDIVSTIRRHIFGTNCGCFNPRVPTDQRIRFPSQRFSIVCNTRTYVVRLLSTVLNVSSRAKLPVNDTAFSILEFN